MLLPTLGWGAFIYRNADGEGTFTKTGVQLRWNYGANGVSDAAALEIEAYAIEMVFVPEGSFYVGTGDSEAGSFTDGSWTSGVTIPFQITSENALDIAQNAGKLWGILSSTIGTAGTLAASFPKGYGSFYCMKYEISQQGYVDFLNSLTYGQQTARTANAPSSAAGTGALIEPITWRNGIDIMTPGVSSTTPAVYACNLNENTTYSEADDGQNVACNYLITADVAAYLDWSGLRPMTELEFEKACRGTLTPVANECAWGNPFFPPDIPNSRYTISNSGATDEVIATKYATPPVGNVAYNGTNININGPVRVGIFAGTTGNTERVSSGATYYGMMEMSGNLRERTIFVGHATGRLFTGTHGNGELTADGLADALTWPVSNGNGVRGGSIQGGAVTLQVSDRTNAGFNQPNRHYAYGGRGVRTYVPPPVVIGDLYQGGIVAYILQPGDPGYSASVQHGLIAAPVDQSYDAVWGCSGTSISGANGIALGTGNQNTIDIEAGCATAGIAAHICANLTLGGYSDWYLPSKDELNKVYEMNVLGFGSFISAFYWSSSEYSPTEAWIQGFGSGDQVSGFKIGSSPVRAVRAF